MNCLKTVGWSDFVNHAASDVQREAVPKHGGTWRKRYLETGALWRKVGKVPTEEASYLRAAERVRVVKAAFAPAGRMPRRQETGGLIQQLYDSFSRPAPAGTRSAAMRVRQVLYRAGPYQIDLQIELQQVQNRLAVTGQLVDLSHPEMVGRDLQVMISDGRGYTVNTVTNHFGEFRGEIENSGDLEISFHGGIGKPIVILLRGAVDNSSTAKE